MVICDLQAVVEQVEGGLDVPVNVGIGLVVSPQIIGSGRRAAVGPKRGDACGMS